MKAFSAELLGLQGSGWGWLVSKGGPKGLLEIVTTKDQDPVAATDVPVFGVDMWEHAYYLQVSGLHDASEFQIPLFTDVPSFSILTTRPVMSRAFGRSSTGPKLRSATQPELRTR